MDKKEKTEQQPKKKRLTVEELEARIAPGSKKPQAPPYPPGTKYGLISRKNLG